MYVEASINAAVINLASWKAKCFVGIGPALDSCFILMQSVIGERLAVALKLKFMRLLLAHNVLFFYVCLPVSNGSACVFARRTSSHGITCCELVFLEVVSKHEKCCYLTLAVCIWNETPECAEMKRKCCSSSSCSLSPALQWVPTWCDPNKRSELRDEWSNIFLVSLRRLGLWLDDCRPQLVLHTGVRQGVFELLHFHIFLALWSKLSYMKVHFN